MSNSDTQHEGFYTEVPGGGLQYTIGSRPSSAPPVAPADPPASGTFDHNSRDGVTHRGQTKVNAGVLIDHGSLLGTYRDAGGNPSGNHNMNGSIQLVPGEESSRTSVAAAITGGYLKRGNDGSITEGRSLAEAQAAFEELPPAPEIEPYDLFSPADEARFASDLNPYPQPYADAAHAAGSLAAAQGVDGESLVDQVSKNLAQNAGGDPAQHQQVVKHALAAYSKQVNSLLHSEGIAPGEEEFVWQHARSSPQGKDLLSNALNQLTAGRSLSGFRAVLEHFFRLASPSIETLKAKGYNVRGSGANAEVERPDGAWMPVSAVRY